MSRKTLHVDAQTTDESNDFLMSFWGHLAEVGCFSIQYTPRRSGETKYVRLAIIRSNESGAMFYIGYVYKKRHVISTIEINAITDNPSNQSELDRIEFIFNERPRNKTSYYCHHLILLRNINPTMGFKSGIRAMMGTYLGENYAIRTTTNDECILTVNVHAYNEAHFQIELARKLDDFRSLMAIMFDRGFDVEYVDIQPEFKDTSSEFVEEDVFGDYVEYHLVSPCDGVLRYSETIHTFIDRIMGDIITERERQFLRACKMFDMSRITLPLTHIDSRVSNICISTLMSTLEAATLGGGDLSRCKECKQHVYSVASRVADFTRFYGGCAFENMIKHHYKERSKFLHTAYTDPDPRMHCRQVPQINRGAHQDVQYISTLPWDLFSAVAYLLRQLCIHEIIPDTYQDWSNGTMPRNNPMLVTIDPDVDK